MNTDLIHEPRVTGHGPRATRILCLVCFLCFLCLPPSLSATTIAGTIKTPADAGVTGSLELELSAPGRVADPALLLVQPRVTCAISAGAIAPGCSVRGNDTLTDPGNTHYRVRILDPAGKELMKPKKYSITGATWNIGTASPLP